MYPLVTDSITRIPPGAAGRPIVCASHGGLYSAHCALKEKVSSVIFNDAGIGREHAGVAGLILLDRHGIPAAAVSHLSARIGDGRDCLRRGVVSTVNESARTIGANRGMSAESVWQLFASCAPAAPLNGCVGELAEARFEVPGFGDMPVIAMDSNSLVTPTDRNAIVITGSHGGLLGGDPRSAIKTAVFAAVYNDADVGIDNAGLGRLVPLNERGIAAVTVSAWSARIGDARSTLADGVVSFVNERAKSLGAYPGLTIRALLDCLADQWRYCE